MPTSPMISTADLKSAIESRNGKVLADFYQADAVIHIIDRNNPPSKPREIRGKAAIAAYWEDICSREMTHNVEAAIVQGNRLAFNENCAYPDGTKVFCSASADLTDGKIAIQTTVQAWDE